MRAIDMLMAFPYILLALAIVARSAPASSMRSIAVAVVNIPFFARNIRGVTVTLANKEFIDAARLAGMGDARNHRLRDPAERPAGHRPSPCRRRWAG